MSGTYQNVIICGNLARDVEVRNFANGGKVANMTVVTNENWKTKEGEKRERAEFHRIAIFSEGLVRIAEQYLKKGSKVLLTGQLETRKWQDQNGQDKYSTEIVLRGFNSTLTMLDSRTGHDDSQGGGQFDNRGAPGGGGGYGGGLDDEIPFFREDR